MSERLSFVRILSWVFYPLAYLLGLQAGNVPMAARLLGEASHPHRDPLLQPPCAVALQRPDDKSTQRRDFDLRALQLHAGGGVRDLRREPRRSHLHAATISRALASAPYSLPRSPRMTGCVAGIFISGQELFLWRTVRVFPLAKLLVCA